MSITSPFRQQTIPKKSSFWRRDHQGWWYAPNLTRFNKVWDSNQSPPKGCSNKSEGEGEGKVSQTSFCIGLIGLVLIAILFVQLFCFFIKHR